MDGSFPCQGHHVHKNRLQEYAQRSGLPLPSYSTINEGEPHAPRFRATILLDGLQFTSPYTFSQRKEAEQDVAKIALEFISVKFKNEGSFNIRKDPAFCKLILNEYAAKLKKGRPSYTTSQQDGLLPIFTTTVIFDGNTYVGFAGRSKREAEQNAACVVIDSILENSATVTDMAQIIKTKGRLYATVNCNATAGNPALRSQINSDDPNAAINGTELMAAAATGSLPTGSSWVPYTSPWVNIAQSNQINYQMPSLGLPMTAVSSQTIISRNKKKRLKKRKTNQSKRRIVGEEPLTTAPL
ncbi:double-stranded RNA-binding protein 4-like isoform X2 [Phalaenopsis equestris]|uniref:double-stranded RNA-binding protein 4-like isoform X2 n=1 Tax=Phalaenopsis equestris TaxID=78828 RepID=UPI0009E2AC37|nr:double-stranded RNA-binding protein 4-like isoform X2 [Phalaenopsis equestris]